ncbi:MAG: SBBP repeat-containing protein [Candidatus Hodarchaeota archaeon]
MKEIAVKIKFDFISTIVILFISLFFISCQKEKDSYKVENINGVRVIHNLSPKWGDKPKVELKFVTKIGGTEVNDESYIFYRPFDLVQDKFGNKYILSWDNFRIRKFDSKWKYLSSFGREGQGPGYILNPSGLAIDSQSNIYVIESRNRRIQKINTDGTPLNSFKMNNASNSACILKSGNLVLEARSFYQRGQGFIDSVKPTMLAIMNQKNKILRRFVKCQEFKDIDLMNDVNRVNFDIDDEDNIYVTFENQNRIEKYSPDGTLLFSADRLLNYKIEHTVDKENYSIPVPILTFVSVDIRVDNKGRIWVTTFDKQPESQGTRGATLRDHKKLKFELFDKDGVLLGKVPVPIEFYKKRIYGDTLYLIDPYFEACIYEYKIIEK